MAEAQQRVEQLRNNAPPARVQDALTQAAELAQQREARKKGAGIKARASTTDADAHTMKNARWRLPAR